jgi:hypothetical protein
VEREIIEIDNHDASVVAKVHQRFHHVTFR